jgi:predicted dehydrogenase
MTRLPVGMIGVGNFGAARRALMRKTGLFDILAVFDHNSERLADAAGEEGARACGSVDVLLADARIAGVVISTGATSHAELAERAMRRGKHVFVEKPLCCSIDEIVRLRRAREETGRVVGVGHHQNDSDTFVVLARQMIDRGDLGEVAAYEKNTSHSGGFQIQDVDWRGRPEFNPGGMLFQCGVHAIHALNAIFGPVTEVQAAFRYDVNARTRTADVAAVTLRHTSGLLGTLNCYHVTAYCHELRLFGTKGNLYMDTFEQRAWYQKALYGPREPRIVVPLPDIRGADVANLVSWHDAIRGGCQANPDLEQGIAALLPVFAAEIAARRRRTVSIKEVESPTDEPGVATTKAPRTRSVVKSRLLHPQRTPTTLGPSAAL